MPIESDADRRMFVEEDDFAVRVAWTHSGGTATFSAIFDDDYALIASPYLDAGAEGSTPQFIAPDADIPATGKQDDVVVVRHGTPSAKSYTVVEFKPDGTGMTVVRLQEV